MADNQPTAQDISRMAFEAALNQQPQSEAAQIGFDAPLAST